MGFRNSGVYPPHNRSKKAFKEAAMTLPDRTVLYATALFNNFPDASVSNLEPGQYTVVGPDPATKRSWYATLEITEVNGERKVKVS